MFRAKTVIFTLALLVAMSAAKVQASEEKDILSLIPSEVQVVVVVKDFQSLSDDLAAVSQKLEIPAPQMSDLLGTFQAESGFTQGLDVNGTLAIAMPYLPMMGGEPPVFIFVPVTDYTAFAGNFGLTEVGEGVTSIEYEGRPAYIRSIENYAVISMQEPMLTNLTVPSNGGLAASTGTHCSNLIASSDAFVYVNLTQIGPMVSPMVATQIQQAMGQFQMREPEEFKKFGWTMDAGSAFVQAILRDGQSLTIGADVTTDGVGLKTALEFKEGSNLAKMFSKKPTSKLAFNRLPAGDFFLVSSMDMSVLPIKQWNELFLSYISQDFPFRELIRMSSESMDTLPLATQSGFYKPDLAGAGGFVNSITVHLTNDPEGFLAGQQEMFTTAGTTELPMGIQVQSKYTPNAIQVEGVSRIDSYHAKTTLPPELMAQMGPGAMFAGQMMDQSGYFIPVDGAVVQVIGANPASLKQIAQAANGGKSLFGDRFQTVQAHLLPNRVAETYVNIGEITKYLNNYIAMFAPQYALQLPDKLTPLGIGVSTGDGGIATSAFVPMDTIVTVKDNMLRIMAQGQQQQQPVPTPEPVAPEIN